MTAESPRVDQEVHEYQRQQAVGGLDKVHGFHSRFTRVRTLKDFLRNTVDQQALNQGVLALVLDDTVGLVQQYNYMRNGWIEARQRHIEEPMRAYKHQTSDLLIAIRNMHPIWAEQQTASFEPMTGDGPPIFGIPEVERQHAIQQKSGITTRRWKNATAKPIAPRLKKTITENWKTTNTISTGVENSMQSSAVARSSSASSSMTMTEPTSLQGWLIAKP